MRAEEEIEMWIKLQLPSGWFLGFLFAWLVDWLDFWLGFFVCLFQTK